MEQKIACLNPWRDETGLRVSKTFSIWEQTGYNRLWEMHHSSVGGLLRARISFMFGIILCLPQFSSNFICCFSCFLINSYSTLYYKCKVFLMIHLSVKYSILFAYSHFSLFSYCHPWNRADQTSSLLNPTVTRYVLKNGCEMKKRESLSFYKKLNSIVSLWIKQS